MVDFAIINKAVTGVALMIVLDIAAGFVAAVSRGEVDSKKLREGLMHKVGLMLAVALAIAMEYENAMFDLGINIPIVTAMSTYIIIMEACSVYENIRKINPEFQFTKLEDIFKELDKKDKKEGQDNE